MPTFRPDVREISPYRPGRPIADVAREHGFDPDDIVKLASNENPLPPIPAAVEAIRRAAVGVNRYPDNETRDLRWRLADTLGLGGDHVWIGGGSSDLLRVIATAVGGPGTSAVYAWPSFVIYRLASILAMSTRIEVPLDSAARHDVTALAEAIRPDTTVVYLCNPNNPTGTLLGADEVERFVDGVPERVLVVIDEAYHEYVTDPAHRTAIPLAIDRPNVVVTRTFSKIFGLANLRVGYAVSRPENIVELRKAQAPFTVSTPAQVAAIASLDHIDEVMGRVADNTSGRTRLEEAMTSLGVDHVPSQANFVWFHSGRPVAETIDHFVGRGIILRSFGEGWVRASVGTADENERFVAALGELVETDDTGGG